MLCIRVRLYAPTQRRKNLTETILLIWLFSQVNNKKFDKPLSSTALVFSHSVNLKQKNRESRQKEMRYRNNGYAYILSRLERAKKLKAAHLQKIV